MSEDHKLTDTGDYNLFRYCHNDPEDLTDPMGTEPPVAHSAQEMSKLIAEMREGQKQLAQLRAYVHAMEYPGHGAIGIGMANFQIDKLSQALGSSSIGRPLAAAPRESAVSRARQLPLDENSSSENLGPGDIFFSHYGYPKDKYFDTNSNISRIGNRRNTLDDDSLALTAKVARSYGLHAGNKVYINGRYLGNYDDTAPQRTQSRIDIYDRYGQFPQNWGGVLHPPFTISSRPHFEPWTPSVEF